MGWGTQFDADIYLSHESIRTKLELEECIEEVENDIQHIREKLMMFCAAGLNSMPKKDVEGNDMEPISMLHYELKELLEWYNECLIKRYQYSLLKEDWDEKEGKFKTAFCG